MDDSGRSWGTSLRIRGTSLRIRSGLNIHLPLKRALKVRSTVGDEILVRLTYKPLPNFCYLCGRLGHIDKYCELRFGEGFQDRGGELPYRSWLRAPNPPRVGSLDQIDDLYRRPCHRARGTHHSKQVLQYWRLCQASSTLYLHLRTLST
ncbi:UNVERIFIED_CONTAM: hypothetical protein Sradi_2336100 [Sesamum radiatum]|uniref:CCHC-type domain-containing protein n=1 Tax=Sesamum radiatum TaxID=300843 RepID=A0AAW2T598_SESRA